MGFIQNSANFVSKLRLDKIDDSIESDIMLMAVEIGEIPCFYEIDHEIISENFWEYLKTELKLDEKNVTVRTYFEIDEDKREIKNYKYYVRIGNLYFVFHDESKYLTDDDFITEVTEVDKKDKIMGLRIYYASNNIRYVDDEIVPKIKELIHISVIQNQFFIISSGPTGYDLRTSFVKSVEMDLEMNYGKGFVKIDQTIIDSLTTNKNGLYLLHGPSGCGKTTWIRRLISHFGEKRMIIYIPSFMIYHLSDPEMISFISRFKNAILILEDAENVLTKSVEERSMAVSNLLNFSDGILGDNLNIQIIATFNVDKSVIDEALLRAGRLRVNYKFKLLTAKQATALSAKIGLNTVYTEPKTLADVYEGWNQLIDTDDLDQKKIGFKFSNE